ncbi:fructosamine kinase family protein [Faecalibacter rhinopitheci]|uniref:Fructosamine kinase family protein n=1 Tax=Faecalibacter rhinopitheci TaxID=2779678 RepID=A0A8J7FWX3_9FLAO|nr:fructosamine kinase family protein [Faecalibacter rhinopitheci]MBF0597108.1 fructosamine kinase family protein [Faecalibacter rhinopitheci]MBQ0147988.1 fructosamine kinase family protein [Candidatus Onthonaster equi]
MNEILERLKSLNLDIENIFPVKGGDINDSYRVESYKNKYFLKLNTAQNFPQLFEKEAKGLQTISETELFSTPKIIKHGITNNDFQYLLLEWLDRGEPTLDNWEKFGHQVAQLHQITNDNFGWEEDNYIAIIIQPNQYKSTWEEFYAESRILPMVKLLVDKNVLNSKERKAAERLCLDLINIFPKEKPALIHGDLWNGNIFPKMNGEITPIDPAVYYGHREMDIAMADLFGGFDESFFNAYNEINPLQDNFEERKPIAQLFPLLVHAFLYEGYYIKDVQTILKKFYF